MALSAGRSAANSLYHGLERRTMRGLEAGAENGNYGLVSEW